MLYKKIIAMKKVHTRSRVGLEQNAAAVHHDGLAGHKPARV
jgi:hypothetical protein